MSSGSLVPSTSNTGLSKRSDTIFDASSRRWKTVVRGVYSPCVNTLLSHDVQCGSQICISLSLTNVDTNTMTEQTKYRSLSCISVTLFYCSQLACHMTNKNSPLCLSHDKPKFSLMSVTWQTKFHIIAFNSWYLLSLRHWQETLYAWNKNKFLYLVW